MISTASTLIDSCPVSIHTVSNKHITAVVTDVGARLLQLHVPDRNGNRADVVLARPEYSIPLADPGYMGSTVGRYASRIRRGVFVLDGTRYEVATNDGPNHLHGGVRGYDQQVWESTVLADEDSVLFSRISGDGEEGYPGRVEVTTRYHLNGPSLEITMGAVTDRSTLVNLVNHCYFNLGGHASGSVLNHELQLAADFYTPVDDELLPSGEVRFVQGTPYDFRVRKRIGADIDAAINGTAGRLGGVSGGFDDNWVLDGTGHRPVATLADPESGRVLELSTNQPGLQVYTAWDLDGMSSRGPLAEYAPYAGVTLETQTFPDAANVAHFPSPVLRPDQAYENTMFLTFSVE